MDVENTVRRLNDLESIRDLARRYAHGVWSSDVEGVVALFTEDGEMDPGNDEPIRGREAIRKVYGRMIGAQGFQPFVHNHVICLDGDQATGVCYLDLRAVADDQSLIGAGYYVDSYVRVEQGWKFKSRRLRMNFLVPIAAGWAEAIKQTKGMGA